MPQLSITPLSLVTPIQMNVCGLVQSNRLTTPVIVLFVDASSETPPDLTTWEGVKRPGASTRRHEFV